MAVELPPTLELARIQGLPAAAYYIPSFISEEEERLILGKVRCSRCCCRCCCRRCNSGHGHSHARLQFLSPLPRAGC